MSKYFYIHVPKTGGTTIDHHFCNQFAHDSITHCESLFNKGDYKAITKKTYASGHISYQKLLRSSVQFDILIVSYRDPLKQLISHLRWLIYIGEDTNSKVFKSHPEGVQKIALRLNQLNFDDVDSVTEFVATMSGNERGLFDNFLTRFLCPYEVRGSLNEHHLHGAMETIRDFDFLIETATIGADIAAIFEHEGLRPVTTDVKKNVGTAALPAENLEHLNKTLEPLYQYDLQLYESLTAQKKKQDSLMRHSVVS